MNKGFCNSCGKLVVARLEEREGRIYLVKDCPTCGLTETPVSSDAQRYYNKRRLDKPFEYRHCDLECLQCLHRTKPDMVFVDITNRCNMNCPICINNTPSMGFLFEPPIEYFETIFSHFAQYDPKPAIQIFGGEPTVRKDLFEIIRLARSYGLAPRVVTNGLKLADEEYCRELIESKATILIAYDGANPELYSILRANPGALALKLKAFENIEKIGRAKTVVMSLVAKGFNDDGLAELFMFCHERRESVRGIYLMPLTPTWDPKRLDLEPERLTTEDIERIVDACFPHDRIDFVPAGFLGEIQTFRKYLRIRPAPFSGAHPNCESMYLLISDGERYVPLSRYVKSSTLDFCKVLLETDTELARKIEKLERAPIARLLAKVGLKDRFLFARAFVSAVSILVRHLKFGEVLKGKGIGKVWHLGMSTIKLFLRQKTQRVLAQHTKAQAVLQVIILPFEDPGTLETERLERCPAVFAFVDPGDSQVKCVPTCGWDRYKAKVMRDITDFYTRAPQSVIQADP
jgi:uncharacterized radical SAM superfamily Fe-S cluster-containing enzyme